MKKWKGRNITPDIRIGIAPTKERCCQNGGIRTEIVSERGIRSLRYRAAWECPLDAYRDHKVIDGAEYKAGLKFHQAYYGVVVCTRPDFRQTSKAAARRKPTKTEVMLKKVYAALPPEDLGVVIDICGRSNPARDERTLNILKRGLAHLTVLWRIATTEVCGRKRP